MKCNNYLSLITLAVLIGFSISLHANPPTPVFVALVEEKNFVDEVEALGTLKANENVEINSTVTELITNINFEDGERVKKGDVLVEMDFAQEKAEIEEEESRLNEARRQVDRLQPLIARGAASKSLLDERAREVQTAQARMSAIQARINQRIIKAPFDGVVGLRNISVGALAQPGTLVTTIDDDSVMKLDFSVPEIFLSSLKSGVNITATASAYPDTLFSGSVSSVDSRINPVTRSIIVRAILANDDSKLKPGMLMSVVLLKNPRNTLVIPEESVLLKGSQHYVFVCMEKDSKVVVTQRNITIGTRRKGEIEVLSGLDEGDKIVTHGTSRIREGAEVMIDGIEKSNESLTDLLNQNNQSTAP